jgi:hypothetical protein
MPVQMIYRNYHNVPRDTEKVKNHVHIYIYKKTYCYEKYIIQLKEIIQNVIQCQITAVKLYLEYYLIK